MKSWNNYNIYQNTYYPEKVEDLILDKKEKIHKTLYNNALNLAIIDDLNDDEPLFTVITDEPEMEEDIVRCYRTYFIDEEGETIYSDWKYTPTYDIVKNLENVELGYVDLIEWRIYEDDTYAVTFYDPTDAVVVSKKLRKKFDKDGKLIGIDGYVKWIFELRPYWENDYNAKIMARYPLLKTIDDEYPYNNITEYNYVKGTAVLENKIENTKKKIKFSNISTDDSVKIQLF